MLTASAFSNGVSVKSVTKKIAVTGHAGRLVSLMSCRLFQPIDCGQIPKLGCWAHLVIMVNTALVVCFSSPCEYGGPRSGQLGPQAEVTSKRALAPMLHLRRCRRR